MIYGRRVFQKGNEPVARSLKIKLDNQLRPNRQNQRGWIQLLFAGNAFRHFIWFNAATRLAAQRLNAAQGVIRE